MHQKVRWGPGGEDFSCHHCQISRRLPKEQAPSHKQWPPRPRLSSLRPKKRPTFCWWNVQMQSIQRRCCILTKFMLVIKSTCDFFQVLTRFYPGNKFICAGVTWTQTWVSISNLCQIKCLPHKTIGLISIQFTGNDNLHIIYTSTKIYANWMSASSSILYLNKRPLFLHA